MHSLAADVVLFLNPGKGLLCIPSISFFQFQQLLIKFLPSKFSEFTFWQRNSFLVFLMDRIKKMVALKQRSHIIMQFRTDGYPFLAHTNSEECASFYAWAEHLRLRQ